jgi:methylphosphotriester-DNA--protein-cysteine methyltransferase
MSQKHLITQCKRMIGITPKMLARIYRFQRLLSAMNPRQPVDWAALAHRLSYYDQSHFNKDLKAFTGLTPTAYLRRRRQVLEVAPEHAKHLHHLATG